MARWISIFPLHGSGRFVVLTDVSQELFVQIRNGSEYASGDDVALDLAEPQLNLIQPRRVGRSEVQVNLGIHCQEVRDRPALVSREVVGDSSLTMNRGMGRGKAECWAVDVQAKRKNPRSLSCTSGRSLLGKKGSRRVVHPKG